MAKENSARMEYHLKLNKRNPRHVDAALVLASVDKRYKSSFIALAIEHYMLTHPYGISLEELLDMYRQSGRSYQPKTPIAANLENAAQRTATANLPAAAAPHDKAETSSAINKALDLYGIT